MDGSPRAWHVFAAYLAAIASIVAVSGLALAALASWDPDAPPEALLASLPGVLVGSGAAATGFLLTLALIVRPLQPSALRLLPGRETGLVLAVAVAGVLTLGQALDSATFLLGLGERGTVAMIRRLLEGVVGPELFGAVVLLGVVSPAAEELFFRGYMQTRLRARWRPAPAVLATSVCFAALHLDVSGVHVVLALLLSLYLGFVAELTGSTLPAIVCHVLNNVIYTLQVALGFTVTGRAPNAALAVGCGLAFAACVLWLRRAVPRPGPA